MTENNELMKGNIVELSPQDAQKLNAVGWVLRLVGRRNEWRSKALRSYEVIGKNGGTK